ncbi:4'-phosphopantetheinyl transferase superfamily protein [Streptomyces sp. SS7]|uniref:4'-phosphopantetheinyl transferase family protein n=1 Tax=Streptomyces sp. SS7 TaxID=3108485 RepID=UPI0030ECD99F
MHAVQVSWARSADAHEELLDTLDPVERARWSATVDPATRDRFLVGCALSRRLLGELLGVSPEDVPLRRVCPTCGGPHGKPRLAVPDGYAGYAEYSEYAEYAEYDFSVTHSGDVVGVAVCRGARVGLDVEEADTVLDVDAAARTALSARESAALYALPPDARGPAFLRIWTRKEAVLKALGVGLRAPLRQLEVSAPDTAPAVLTWPDQLPAAHRTTLTDLTANGMHPAALAVIPSTVRTA